MTRHRNTRSVFGKIPVAEIWVFFCPHILYGLCSLSLENLNCINQWCVKTIPFPFLLEWWDILALSHKVQDWTVEHSMIHVIWHNKWACLKYNWWKYPSNVCVYCMNAMGRAFGVAVWELPMSSWTATGLQGYVLPADIKPVVDSWLTWHRLCKIHL